MAEISELIGCILLENLNKIIDPENHGLYRDDGIIIVDEYTPRKGDLLRKKLNWLFGKFGFKLDIQTNLKIADYLDITLNIQYGTVSPFTKDKQNPRYINIGSNHPQKVFENIPNGIMVRLSTNSSNSNIFDKNKTEYEKAFKDSGYKTKLIYKDPNKTPNTNNTRKID